MKNSLSLSFLAGVFHESQGCTLHTINPGALPGFRTHVYTHPRIHTSSSALLKRKRKKNKSLLQSGFRFVFLFMALLWAVVSLMQRVLGSVCVLGYCCCLFCFFSSSPPPSKQTSPVLLFISSTRCHISLQQNGQSGGGGRRETDSHAQATAPPILSRVDPG